VERSRDTSFKVWDKSAQVLIIGRRWADSIWVLAGSLGLLILLALWFWGGTIAEPKQLIPAIVGFLVIGYLILAEARHAFYKLREPPTRFDRVTGRISRGLARVADCREVDRVQLRTIHNEVAGDEHRLSLVLTSGRKVFLYQGRKRAESDRAAAAIAETLDVELHRR
jgi:hypothetical protein